MSLTEKLHPARFPGMSGKMAAIVGFVLDEPFTRPEIADLCISSDGFVTTLDDFIGTADDLERNWSNLLDAADLTDEERSRAQVLFVTRITDWRRRDA